eukprot:SAG31_NODE_972_length_10644_cov_3.435372_3_plen_271_part_00
MICNHVISYTVNHGNGQHPCRFNHAHRDRCQGCRPLRFFLVIVASTQGHLQTIKTSELGDVKVRFKTADHFTNRQVVVAVGDVHAGRVRQLERAFVRDAVPRGVATHLRLAGEVLVETRALRASLSIEHNVRWRRDARTSPSKAAVLNVNCCVVGGRCTHKSRRNKRSQFWTAPCTAANILLIKKTEQRGGTALGRCRANLLEERALILADLAELNGLEQPCHLGRRGGGRRGRRRGASAAASVGGPIGMPWVSVRPPRSVTADVPRTVL